MNDCTYTAISLVLLFSAFRCVGCPADLPINLFFARLLAYFTYLPSVPTPLLLNPVKFPSHLGKPRL